MSFLLDTCFISELTKRRRDQGVLRWLEEQDESDLFLSIVTIGELEKGLAKVRDARRRERLNEFIEVQVVDRFRERMIEIGEPVWRRWGTLCGVAERAGRPLPVLDALVAAAAQVHGMTVVTRNEADFLRCEVPVVNPWRRA
ncbi:MAG: type II toxin-antitoxin system VapC family toxin [Myxococcales bacterium]|nr:type II toxin-antitoxin system VapC family toxin [Myxococcales bacterium]